MVESGGKLKIKKYTVEIDSSVFVSIEHARFITIMHQLQKVHKFFMKIYINCPNKPFGQFICTIL